MQASLPSVTSGLLEMMRISTEAKMFLAAVPRLLRMRARQDGYSTSVKVLATTPAWRVACNSPLPMKG